MCNAVGSFLAITFSDAFQMSEQAKRIVLA
jgi:hypothetical protein